MSSKQLSEAESRWKRQVPCTHWVISTGKGGLAQTPHRILRWVRADREYLEAIFGKPCYDPDTRLAIPSCYVDESLISC